MLLKHESITEIATVSRAELHEEAVAFTVHEEKHQQVLESLCVRVRKIDSANTGKQAAELVRIILHIALDDIADVQESIALDGIADIQESIEASEDWMRILLIHRYLAKL